MAKLHYVGFNGYSQCPERKSDPSKVINNWACIPFPEALNVCCTHRFMIIETKDEFLFFGSVTEAENSPRAISKPFAADCFGSCEEFLLVSENTNLWKYGYKESNWTKLILGNLKSREEAVWKEADNKIVKVSFRSDVNDAILLCSNGSIWMLSDKNELRLFFSPDVERAVDLDSGLEHTIILTESGCVLSFGNGRGQLGDGNLDSAKDPIQIPTLEGLKITGIAAGSWHSCAVTDSGDLCTWGWNNFGQLAAFEGGEELGLTALPVFVDVGPSDGEEIEVVQVSCGSRHTAVKSADGDVYATGWNTYRQLGIDSATEKVSKFTKCNITGSENQKLICGPWYTVLLEN